MTKRSDEAMTVRLTSDANAISETQGDEDGDGERGGDATRTRATNDEDARGRRARGNGETGADRDHR